MRPTVTDLRSSREAGVRARHAVLAAAAVGVLVGGVVAAEASPTETTVCVSANRGAMRYVASGVCGVAETAIVLGRTGPNGPPGAQGAAGGYPSVFSIKEIAGTHALTATDAGKLLLSDTYTRVTIPTDSTVDFPLGTVIFIVNKSRIVYLEPAAGVTLNGGTGVLVDTRFLPPESGVQAQMAVLLKKNANDWWLLQPLKET